MPRLSCALGALVIACPAFAQQATPPTVPTAEDDVLVVGQRDAPIAIQPRGLSVSLGEEQFRGVSAFNAEDLIKYAPDFFVRTRYVGDNNAVPGFRGTHSTQSARSLVMVDGFVVSNFLGNSFSFPPAWGVVSPSEVRQFDIVYGPYSARYPGNSMGGIVNITTRPPEKDEVFATAQAFVQPYRQYGTRQDFRGWSGEAGFSIKEPDSPLGLRVSLHRLRNDSQPMQFYQLGYTPALYAQPNAGTPVIGAYFDPKLIPVTGTRIVAPVIGDYSSVATTQDQARAQLRFDRGDWHAEALFTYWWNREETLHPRTYLRDANGADFHGDASGRVSIDGHTWNLPVASTFRQGLFFKNEWLGGLRLEGPVAGFVVRANLSTLRFDRQDSFSSNGYAAGEANGAGQATIQGPTGWWTADLLATRDVGSHAVAFGMNANRYETDQSVYGTRMWRAGAGKTLRTRPVGRTRTTGVFAEDAVTLAPGTLLTLGARADWWRAFDGGLGGPTSTRAYPRRTDFAFSPKASLRSRLGSVTAELSLAQATRFPTVGELFQGSLNGDGSFNLNSFDPNLRPEKSNDANLLLRRGFGPLSLTGSLFYQRVDDAIFSFVGFNQNGVSTSSFKNIDRTRQWGVELIGELRDWPARGLDLDANGAWIDAKTLRNDADPASEGVQFPRIPRWRLNGNLRWRLLPRVQAVAGVRYASRPNTDLDGLQRGDAYGYTSELFALDLKGNLDLTDTIRLSAGVNNVTNDRAWVFHPYPQRTFLVEMGALL